MKRIYQCMAACLCILGLAGCVVNRSASTVVRYSIEGEAHMVGLKTVHWSESQDTIELIGYGWHPREHENYAFFLNEPYPTFKPRWIRLSGTTADYQVTLVLPERELRGKLHQLERHGDRITFLIEDVAWDAQNDLRITGEVVATRASNEVVEAMTAKYHSRQNKRMESNG